MALSPSELLTLKTEIALPAYAGLDEPAVADALNAKNITADVDVLTMEINSWLVGRGVWGGMDARRDWLEGKVGVAPAVGSAEEARLKNIYTARRALELLPKIDMSNGPTRTFFSNVFGSLVVEGVMTTAQRDGLLNLASGFISRAEELFGRGRIVESGDVSRAKKV